MSTPSRFKKDKEIIAEYESQVKVNEENSGPAFGKRKDSTSLNEPFLRSHQESSIPFKDSTLHPSDLKKLSFPGEGVSRPLPKLSRRTCQSTPATGKAANSPSCSADKKEAQESPNYKHCPSAICFKFNGNRNEFHIGNSLPASLLQSNSNLEKKELELHLYIISTTSSIFLRLRSSWNNYVITSDLFCFPVNKLLEYLPESRDKNALQNKSQRADELMACIKIIQTLGLMFRETEIEPSRLNTLAAKNKPKIPKCCPVFDIQLVTDSEVSFDAELQKLLLEYTDTATALLYEILLVFQQIAFVASVVKGVVNGLSASLPLLSPCQAVLMYQQFCILKSCLKYSKTLAECVRNDYSEEFRHFIHMPALEKRLPLCYPITEPTTQLFLQVLQLIEQKYNRSSCKNGQDGHSCAECQILLRQRERAWTSCDNAGCVLLLCLSSSWNSCVREIVLSLRGSPITL